MKTNIVRGHLNASNFREAVILCASYLLQNTDRLLTPTSLAISLGLTIKSLKACMKVLDLGTDLSAIRMEVAGINTPAKKLTAGDRETLRRSIDCSRIGVEPLLLQLQRQGWKPGKRARVQEQAVKSSAWSPRVVSPPPQKVEAGTDEAPSLQPKTPEARQIDSWVAVDVETTGGRKTDQVIEIGIVAFKDGSPVFSWGSLIDPGRSVPGFITKLTGIRTDDVQGKPTFKQVAKKVHAYLGRLGVVAAHNASFDVRMLRAEFERAGMEWPEVEVICTMKEAKALLPGLENHRLPTVCKALKVKQGTHHRASSDAEAAGRVLSALQQKRRAA